MAGAIQLTEVDFEKIKENLVQYLKSTKEFTDYNFEGSNLSVILNLIAYQAQLNAYTANMIANESFLASASLRDNVVSNADRLDTCQHLLVLRFRTLLLHSHLIPMTILKVYLSISRFDPVWRLQRMVAMAILSSTSSTQQTHQ
jgi:hypothetical protein